MELGGGKSLDGCGRLSRFYCYRESRGEKDARRTRAHSRIAGTFWISSACKAGLRPIFALSNWLLAKIRVFEREQIPRKRFCQTRLSHEDVFNSKTNCCDTLSLSLSTSTLCDGLKSLE